MTTRALTLALLLASLAAAPLPAQEAARPLIASLHGDWNGDGFDDLVSLHQNGEGLADIDLFEGTASGAMVLRLRVTGAVYAGTLAGQIPALEARGPRGFAILAEQIAIGRTPWESALGIEWIDGTYRLTTFDYAFQDRLDPEHFGSCAVDFHDGRFKRMLGPGAGQPIEEASGAVGAAAPLLSDLAEGLMPTPCVALFR